MNPHSFAGGLPIVPLDRLQDLLMMVLASLRPAIYREDSPALFAQQTNDRVEQRKNQGVFDGFSQSQVKVKVSFYVGVRIVEVAVHYGDRFSHCREQLFINA
jgi:hypothetical protein